MDLHSFRINCPPLHQIAGVTTSWLLYFKLLEEVRELSLLANCVNNKPNFSKLYRLVTTISLQKMQNNSQQRELHAEQVPSLVATTTSALRKD